MWEGRGVSCGGGGGVNGGCDGSAAALEIAVVLAVGVVLCRRDGKGKKKEGGRATEMKRRRGKKQRGNKRA